MIGAVVSTRIGFGRTIVRPLRSSWTRGRYTPSGTTRSRLSRPSHVYETRPAGSRQLLHERADRAAVPIQDVERHGLAAPQHDRDDRDVARALAHGREDAIDARPGDGAPLELQPLGDRERGGRRSEKREDEQELRPPRHRAEVTAALARARARTARRARSRSSSRRTPRRRGSRARCADAGTRAAPSRSARRPQPSARSSRSTSTNQFGTNQFSGAGVHSVLDVGAYVSTRRTGWPGVGRVATATESKRTRWSRFTSGCGV